MRSAMRTAHRARLAAILALGAFAVHQLRYLIAFGSSSSEELARQGHGYMAAWLPILGVFTISALLGTLIRGRFGARLAQASLSRRAAIFAAALLAIFVTQESLEGVVAAGHPGGVAAVLGYDGWLAIPLAAAIGFVAALLARALEQVEIAIGARRTIPVLPRAPRKAGSPRPAAAVPRTLDALAFGLARRPPPPVPA
ncbi:MAG: hypothetical protein ACHQCI_09940 [Solirubrobacterales bacterium]